MTTHITIGEVTPRIQYTGDGAQTQFTYLFPIFEDADLEVYEDAALKTITTDYTVAGAGGSSGGSVTFVTAPATGVVVTLLRNVAIKRSTDFQEGGAFRAKTINDELDRMTAGLQQVETDAGRGLKLSATDTATSVTLPDKTTRADQLLGFDANGDPDTSPKTGITGPAGPTGPTGAAGSGLFDGTEATVTPATGDKVALLDVSDTDNPKYATAQSIADLASAAADQTARDNTMLNAFRIAINGGLSVQGMADGVVDEFEDETGVDTVTSTNETYDATNDYYSNGGPQTLIAQGDGTKIGNAAAGGGLAAAFDGNKNQTGASGAVVSLMSNEGKVGKDWGSGLTKVVSGLKVWASNNEGYMSNSSNIVTIYLEGSTDNFLSSIVVLGSFTTTDVNSSADEKMSGFITSTAYRYHRMRWTVATPTSDGSVAEVEFYEIAAAPNMTLVANAASNAPASAPTDAHIILFEEDVAAVTLNTDLKAYASRDGGTTWTQATLTDQGNYATGKRILTGDAVISAQPSGTSMKWKVETLNTKELRLHGVALEWS